MKVIENNRKSNRSEPASSDVLLLEDDPDYGRRALRHFKSTNVRVDWVRNGNEGLKLLGRKGFALYLVNDFLPDMSVFTFLQEAKQRFTDVPFIVIARTDNEHVANEAFKHGAVDYVVKSTGSIRRLTNTVVARLKEPYRFDFAPHSYLQLVENASDAIYFHDAAGRIVFMNRQAEQLTGYGRDELLNRHIQVILEENGARAIRHQLRAKYPKRWQGKIEARIVTKERKLIPVELSMTPIVRNKRLLGFEGIARDIRDRLKAQALLDSQGSKINELNLEIQKKNMKLEERSRLQAEFVSNISHEFRTPLNGIMGYAELLHDEVYGGLNKSQSDALDSIKACATNLLDMVQHLLDLSKIKANRLILEYEPCAPCDLVLAAGGTVRPIARSKGLDVVLHTDTKLPCINADFRRLYQVFVNLAGNAVKFTSSGQIDVGAVAKENAVKFYVRDTGMGVPPELRDMIFQDFRQGDNSASRLHGGMGLGLGLSKRLVELHGGKIGFRVNEDRGSTFFFTIPFSKDSKDSIGNNHSAG